VVALALGCSDEAEVVHRVTDVEIGAGPTASGRTDRRYSIFQLAMPSFLLTKE
jgi:hypothetical protein